MKRLFIILAAIAFSTQAQASFGANDCQSADGSVSYKFRFIWSDPVGEDFWTIDGQKYEARSRYAPGAGPDSDLLPAEVESESLSERQVLESTSTSMTGSSIYTYKVKLTYQKSATETAEREAWVICSSSGGI